MIPSIIAVIPGVRSSLKPVPIVAPRRSRSFRDASRYSAERSRGGSSSKVGAESPWFASFVIIAQIVTKSFQELVIARAHAESFSLVAKS